MRRKLFILSALLAFWGREVTAQALIPEDLPYNKQVVLLKVKSSKLWCVQLWAESSEGASFLVSFRSAGTWKPLPLIRLGRSQNKLVQIHDIEALGSRIYLGGNFIIPGTTKNCLTYFDQLSGTWKSDLEFSLVPPLAGIAPAVHALYTHNNILYTGGFFHKIGALECQHLARIDLKGFAVKNIRNNGNVGASGPVSQIAPDSTGKALYLGGAFRKILGQSLSGLAYFNIADSSAVTINKSFNNVVKLGVLGAHLVVISEEDTLRNKKLFEFIGGQWTKPVNMDTLIQAGSLIVLKSEAWFTGLARVNGSRRSGLFKLTANTVTQPLEKISRIDLAELLNSELYFAGNFFNNLTSSQENFMVARLATDMFRMAGRVFHDKNQNGKFDFGETRLANRLVRVSPGGQMLVTDRNGLFTFLGLNKTGTIYSFSVEGLPGEFLATVTKKIQWDSIPDQLVDFPMKFTKPNYLDFKVNLVSAAGNLSRKDTSEFYYLTVENTGTISGKANLVLNYNNRLIKVTPDLGPNQIDPGKLTWNNISLDPGGQKTIMVKMTAPSTAFNKNETFTVSAATSGLADDNTQNNTDSLNQTVAGFVPPVMKFQQPAAAAGDSFAWYDPASGKIDYTIRFTNTSTDTLDYVVVRDTIYTPSWVTYIQETGNSHPFNRNVYTHPSLPNRVILVYTFTNLRIPPSQNGNPEVSSSSGFIAFRLGTSVTVPNGTSIRNRAVIYKENYNPELTNTVVAKTALNHVKIMKSGSTTLNLYPNPTNGFLRLSEARAGDDIQITDMSGKMLYRFASSESINLAAAGLKQGTYICVAKRNGATYGKAMFIYFNN